MLTPFLALGFSLVLTGQAPESEPVRVPEFVGSMADKLRRTIERNRYRRVGVIPCFLQIEGGNETRGGSTGPQGEWLSEVFARALEDRARGRFQVATNLEMAKAFHAVNLSPDGLGDREALKRLAQHAGGLDALVVGRTVDVRAPARPGATAGRLVKSIITCNLIDLGNGELAGSDYRDLEITPSLAAYRGEPAGSGAYLPLGFELRDLAPKGANAPNLPAQARDGTRPDGTRQGGSAPGPTSPEVAEIPELDDPRCPFPVQVIVDDMPRRFFRLMDPRTGRRELYVNLEPGETYQISVLNKTGKTVYGVVYVDGVNILGLRRDPDNPRFWNIAPGQSCRFRGWYVKEGGTYKEIPLVVRPASDSIAVQLGNVKEGSADRVGEIQCLFFGTEGEARPQAGLAGEPRREAGAKSIMLGRIGTGKGAAREVEIAEVVGPRRSENRLLSFVIHYAPMSQIEKRQIQKD